MESYLIFLYLGRISLFLLVLLLLLSSFLEFIVWASRPPTPRALKESIPIFDFVAKNLKSDPMTKLLIKSTDELGSWANYEKYPILLSWTSEKQWCYCDEIIEQDGRNIVLPYISHIGPCTSEDLPEKEQLVGEASKRGINDVNVHCHNMVQSTLDLRNYLLKSFSWQPTSKYAFKKQGIDPCQPPYKLKEELSICAEDGSGIITDIKYKLKEELPSYDSYNPIGSLNLITSQTETESETSEIRGGEQQIFVSTQVAGHPIVRLGVSYGGLPCLNGNIPISYNAKKFNINGEETGCGSFGTDEELFEVLDTLDARLFFEFNSRKLFTGKSPQSFNLMHVDNFKKALIEKKVILFLERKLVMSSNEVCDQLLVKQPITDHAKDVEPLERIRRINFYTICGGALLLTIIFLIYWVLTRNVGMRKERTGIYFFWISHLVVTLLSIAVLVWASSSLVQVKEIERQYEFLFSVSSNGCFSNSKKINQAYKMLEKSAKNTYEFSLRFIYFDLVMVCLFLLFEIGLLIAWGSAFQCMFNLEGVEEMKREEHRRIKTYTHFDD